MKNRTLGNTSMAILLAGLALASGCIQQESSAIKTPTTSPPAEGLAAAADEISLEDPSDAAFKRLNDEQPISSTLSLSEPVSEVIKLAAAGIKETVLLAYVERSESTFDLEADEIIHLNDLGVPAAVVSAMLKRDTVLRNIEGAGTAASIATGPVTTI